MKPLFLTVALAALAVSLEAAAPARPNILVILADDLGYGDVQCYNPERGKIATPNIDRLAREGMRFTDGHASSASCSPSRYTLLTGRYHWRTRLQSGIVGQCTPGSRLSIRQSRGADRITNIYFIIKYLITLNCRRRNRQNTATGRCCCRTPGRGYRCRSPEIAG